MLLLPRFPQGGRSGTLLAQGFGPPWLPECRVAARPQGCSGSQALSWWQRLSLLRLHPCPAPAPWPLSCGSQVPLPLACLPEAARSPSGRNPSSPLRGVRAGTSECGLINQWPGQLPSWGKTGLPRPRPKALPIRVPQRASSKLGPRSPRRTARPGAAALENHCAAYEVPVRVPRSATSLPAGGLALVEGQGQESEGRGTDQRPPCAAGAPPGLALGLGRDSVSGPDQRQ